MARILSIVTNEQLAISLIIDIVLFCAAVSGILFNSVKIFYAPHERNKGLRILIIVVCTGLLFFIIPETQKNYSIYRHSTIVKGKIKGFCITSKNEEGIEFIYYLNNQSYTNCNAYFPYPKDSLNFDKEYDVRVNLRYPYDGRIILK